MFSQRLLRQFDVDLVGVRKMIDTFMQATGLAGEPEFTCIYQSTDFKDRQVYKVVLADQIFALKLDAQGAQSGRLKSEFEMLERLHAGFASYEKADVPKPLFLSQDGRFFVSAFLDFKTGDDIIQDVDNDKNAAQVYRRAGQWLDAMHQLGPITTAKFWPNWMVESLTDAVLQKPAADPVIYQPMIAVTKLEAHKLTKAQCIKALCHGDFHGRNVILGRGGVTYGLDVTEACEKLAIYDIVDFLKGDIYRQGAPEDIDASGVLSMNKAMFFKLYRHPVNLQVLDFSLRTRLLIDWLSISQARHDKSAFQRRKFALLETRLKVAFR